MRELMVVGVRIELPSNQPLVLLKEIDGPRHLPIWIGAPEASAIAMSQQGMATPRPMTHDLLEAVVSALGHPLVEARLVAVKDTVFYAELEFDGGASVDSRASDAIAFALRAGCPITCSDEVLEEAGVMVSEDGNTADGAEDQVRQFREFLADVEPEDFGE
ncbi:bifunctional nuclease family protein [Arthrobacter sp.]|uniref:bifunctional nuclease family protein n=1 Tax=Arthrobacter sp. TaxID=1667 RepID=UPI003A957018